MSNEIIGIKQADGSFYPILQDGKPDNKTIELTTVRDGQTTAQIHLYKKDPGSLDEPVYVDTLLIENLVPHPKREPTMNLNINLDENNVLTAKVADPETGNSSDIRVSLVTVPESQLQAQSDFTVTDAESVFAGNAHNAMPEIPDFSEEAESAEEPEAFDDEAAETEQDADSTAADDTELSADSTTRENKADDFSFDMPDFDTDEFDAPAEKSTESENDSAAFDDFNLEDSDLNFDDSDAEPAFAEKTAEAAMPEIPDFSEEAESAEKPEAFDDEAAETEQDAGSTAADDTELSADSTTRENKADDFSFDMPDFDTDEFDAPAEKSTESKDDPAAFDDFNLEDSNLNFDDSDAEPAFAEKTAFVQSQSATKESPPLYDLNLPDDIDENAGKKKCRIPMLICIICAILCILAVIGIFLRLPWKNRAGSKTADANIVTVEPPDQKVQPQDAVPPAPEENTIVIVEQEKVEKQEVIPEKTEPAPEVKPQTVRYLIKWGDTLWDLSDTYYRNPWLYPIIARENKIKNPDLIIAGTYINIPPR